MKRKSLKLIGLRIFCPNEQQEFTILRRDMGIGPISDINNMKYQFDCQCGVRHEIKCKRRDPLPEKK